MIKRPTLLARLYRLKLLFVGALFVILGLLTSTLAEWLAGLGVPHLAVATIGGLSDVFLVTGAIGVAVDFFTGRDREAADTERLRIVLKEAAPDIRNAVIAGFAETPENMRGVATNETLDRLAINALALRLGDGKFAGEIYAGLLAQAVSTPERWSDVDINVRISSIDEGSTPSAARSDVRARLFDVVVTWAYTVTPSNRIQRFAATNSLLEFNQFVSEIPGTSAWYISSATADARERDAFEVLSYSVDSQDLTVRRSARRDGQTYSVDLGEARMARPREVRIRQVYRTVVRKAGHRFRIALTQPTHGLRLVLDHSDTDIAELKVGDMLSTAVPARVKSLPPEVPGKQVEVSVPGWLLPRAEVSFVWTLSGEEAAGTTRPSSRAA